MSQIPRILAGLTSRLQAAVARIHDDLEGIRVRDELGTMTPMDVRRLEDLQGEIDALDSRSR